MPDISEILTFPEGRTLEFKQDLSSLKPIMKSLVAFANTAGGILIIGKRDDGEIIGVPDVLKAEEKLANAIADSISPRLMPEIEIASHDGVSLLVLRVSHWRGPFFLKSQGEEQGVYIRLGSTDRQAGPDILNELKRAINKVSFDELACPTCDKSSLGMKKIETEFAKVGKKVTKKTLVSFYLEIAIYDVNISQIAKYDALGFKVKIK
ncbi:MAG: ATP-dependent DNA helicase RecG [Chlamydiales bacterium]|jgi:ATP-dependent DNA helicase RecG